MSSNDFTKDSMLEMYLFETSTLLEQLDDILLQSEQDENLSGGNVDEIFRIMHTIKGSSAMMEYDLIAQVSHKMEDLFFVVREKGISERHLNSLLDLVLKASDFLKEEVKKLRENRPLSTENSKLLNEMTKLSDLLKDKIPKDISADKSIDVAEEYFLHIRFASDCQMEGLRAMMLVNKLSDFGEILETIPADLDSNAEASNQISENGFYCRLLADCPKETIQNAIQGTLSLEDCRFIDEFPSDNETQSAECESDLPFQSSNTNIDPETDKGIDKGSCKDNEKEDAKDKEMVHVTNVPKQNLISVDLNKLNALMDLVGEIVITESMVIGNADSSSLNSDNFSKASRQLRKLTDELQDIVMSIRMIPVASTFQKMRRIVRDMSKKLSKEVDLKIIGETTEVDKAIIDGIADPLMHLVRNAMDHGLEDRTARIQSNKNPVGQIILSAENAGGDIIISVSDDGKGLDPKMILEKAKAKQLLTKPENDMTDKEIFNLLTLPGFSTRDTVTEYSGRGVGMDVVKKNIEKIGGTVIIDSTKGLGTTISFKIPLTLAIIESMEIRVGSSIYTIPISNIRESFKASDRQLLRDPDGNEMIMIRGVCYPIIRLHRIFNVGDSVTAITDGILLLIDSGDSLACILADELVGKHQVVVKPLPDFLNRYKVKNAGIAGCTIMGDGNISLILDAGGIMEQF